jgi:hypothetical protein
VKGSLALRAVLAIAAVLATAPARPSECDDRDAQAGSWKFGIISDTQWTGRDDGRNPASVAVDIIEQVSRQFIDAKVDLVIAVGDLTDRGRNVDMDIRAAYAQPLYNAGIGFFPLRGNHDARGTGEFRRVFPQTRSGLNNATPPDVFSVANPDVANVPPASVLGRPFAVGTGFTSPTGMVGLTYSFDHKNLRFVLLDQFDGASNTIQPQQGWISKTLAGTPSGHHAIVFGHKGLITEAHPDTLFGDSPAADPAGTDAFIRSLADNGIRYYIGGHDHMHDLTQVWTTDGRSGKVTQLTCASDSNKFYAPAVPSNDERYDLPAFGRTRQTPLAHEPNTVGYYVATVNGPLIAIDFYSAAANATLSGRDYGFSTTPRLQFRKRQVFGYSLNGREFVVGQGQPYSVVMDAFEGTRARILDGVNGSVARDGSGRKLSHAVDTGWTPRACGAASATFHLWGMSRALGVDETDAYALALDQDTPRPHGREMPRGQLALLAWDANGRWVNAVDRNAGGVKKFVRGPWRLGYALGAYGFDRRTRTAWAVLNREGEFRIGPLASPPRRGALQ